MNAFARVIFIAGLSSPAMGLTQASKPPTLMPDAAMNAQLRGLNQLQRAKQADGQRRGQDVVLRATQQGQNKGSKSCEVNIAPLPDEGGRGSNRAGKVEQIVVVQGAVTVLCGR